MHIKKAPTKGAFLCHAISHNPKPPQRLSTSTFHPKPSIYYLISLFKLSNNLISTPNSCPLPYCLLPYYLIAQNPYPSKSSIRRNSLSFKEFKNLVRSFLRSRISVYTRWYCPRSIWKIFSKN